MRTALLLSLLLGAIVCRADAQTFRMTDSLATALSALADSATVETARCLFGRTSPDTLEASSAVEPPVRRRAGLIVALQPCPFGALALWHVHVLEQTKAQSPESACFLSRSDIDAGLRFDAPLVMVVHVRRHVWCWWTRENIQDARLIGLRVSPPPVGQLHQTTLRP
jgi:hypothetical protein